MSIESSSNSDAGYQGTRNLGGLGDLLLGNGEVSHTLRSRT